MRTLRAVSVASLLLCLAGSARAQDERPYAVLRREDAKLARTDPEAVAHKYQVMSASPFSYYRGSARLFFGDLKGKWGLQSELAGKDTDVWLNGDAHVANTGVIALADKTLAYDLNDFDESARGPYVLDVQRLAASLILAGGDAGTVEAFARSYLEAMRDIEKGKLGAGFHWTEDNARGAIKDVLEKAAKASRGDQLDELTKDGRFRASAEVVAVDAATRAAVEAGLDAYVRSIPPSLRKERAYYEVLDVSRKLDSGTGSRGLDRFWLLIRGKSGDPRDARVIEWKEERPSAVGAFAPGTEAGFADAAERAVAGERALLGTPDRFLGHTTVGGRPFLARERSPHKASIDLTTLGKKDLDRLAEDVARSLAKAHAFSDADPRGKARAILGRAGDRDGFASRIADFAKGYARKVEADWRGFKADRALDQVRSRDATRAADRDRAGTPGIRGLIERERAEGKDRPGR